MQVIALSPAAARAGVRLGMPRAEVLAVTPEVRLREEDRPGDRRELLRLAEAAERFSPVVGLEEGEAPAALLLDITGCAACFGGEERLLAEAESAFAGWGWEARLAVADTLGAAWALAATSSGKPLRAPPGQTAAWLRPLPVAALRLTDPLLAKLKALGLGHIGQVEALPRAELPARLGPLLPLRLAQAFGTMPEPVVPHRPLPPLSASRAFEFGVARRELLHAVVEELLRQLETELRRRCRGVRRLVCELAAEAGVPTAVEVEVRRPTLAADRLAALLRLKLERVQLAGPVVGLTLRIAGEEPLTDEQGGLFDEGLAAQTHQWAALVEGLSTRLGRAAVLTAEAVADPQPELAYRLRPAVQGPPRAWADADAPGEDAALRHRPIQLFPEPVPVEVLALTPPGFPRLFRSARGEQRLVLSWGPERIETGWWRGDDIQRDYFLVETASGARHWLFRRLPDGHWFWHGSFD